MLCWALRSIQVKNYSPGYMGQEPSGAMRPVCRAGWVWAADGASAAKKAAWAEYTCAGAAHKHFSLILCCGDFPVPASTAQCDEAQGLGKGGALFSSSF